MVDQVLSSGTQLLLIVLVARTADAATFGAVSVALLAHGFLMGLVRAGVGEVVLLRCRADGTSVRREARLGLFVMLIAGVAVGLALTCAGVVVGGQVGRFLLLAALAAPFVYAQDLLRYVAYGAGRMWHAILVDGAWLVVQVIASALLLAGGHATPTWLVLAWVLGAGAGAIAGGVAQRVRPRRVALGRWWAEERARSAGFLTDYLVSNGLWQGSFLLLSVLLPLDEFGGLRVAFISLRPLANVLAGVRILTLAHLGGLRRQPARARVRAALLALALAAPAAAYGIGLALLPDQWGAELFGETWAEAATLVGILAAGEVLRVATFAAIDLVKVLGRPMDLVRTRATGGVCVVGGLLLGTALAGPYGAVVGTAIGYAVNGAIWWRQGWALGQRPPSPVSAAPT